MRSQIAGGALAFVVVLAGGCGSGANSPSAPVGQSSSAIQGGTTDTTHTFALGVCGGADGGPDEGQNCQILCSGALIAPNLVISARHCVDTVPSDTVDCSSETFGGALFPTDQYFVTSNAQMFDPAAKWYQVAQIITPTPTAFCGNDLSIMILSSNIPTSEVATLVTPEIWYPIDSPQYSTSETAIGFGLDSPTDEDSAGVRRILENIGIECIPGDSNDLLACPPEAESGVASNEFAAGNGPCEGDSGSSAYEQNNFNAGKYLSLGVLSRGGSSGNACQGSIYTQLYPWQSLIVSAAKTAATMGGYPLPAWATAPGSTTTDSGTTPTDDSGADSGGDAASGDGKLGLGASCGSSDLCQSDQCVSLSSDGGGFVCSQTCDTASPCPTGYACTQGYCFSGGGSTADASGSGSSGGCSVAVLRGQGRSEEGAEFGTLALGLGLGLWRRRRTLRCARE